MSLHKLRNSGKKKHPQVKPETNQKPTFQCKTLPDRLTLRQQMTGGCKGVGKLKSLPTLPEPYPGFLFKMHAQASELICRKGQKKLLGMLCVFRRQNIKFFLKGFHKVLCGFESYFVTHLGNRQFALLQQLRSSF